MLRDVDFLSSGWTMVCGQKTAEINITSGMPFLAALHRFVCFVFAREYLPTVIV